jgi:hypothetical protein
MKRDDWDSYKATTNAGVDQDYPNEEPNEESSVAK